MNNIERELINKILEAIELLRESTLLAVKLKDGKTAFKTTKIADELIKTLSHRVDVAG